MIYTDENIQADPTIVETMSQCDVDNFYSQYKHKRIISRQFVNQRQRDIKDAEIYAKMMNNAYEHIECIWFMLQGMLNHHDPEHRINRFGRLIGNAIHDMPHIWTGMESRESIKMRMHSKKYNHTDEHFYPRKYAGETILTAAILYGEKFTMATLANLLFKFCHVHRVTGSENKLLERFQKTDVFNTPEEAYQLAGIELEKVTDKEDKYESVFQEIISLLY